MEREHPRAPAVGGQERAPDSAVLGTELESNSLTGP